MVARFGGKLREALSDDEMDLLGAFVRHCRERGTQLDDEELSALLSILRK